MNKLILLSAIALLLTGNAFATGSHSGGHGDEAKQDNHHAEMAVGEPGKKADARKRITITMMETEDGKMIFAPENLDVKKGETVLFTIQNKGELEHELVLDDHHGIMEHKAAMEKFPEMEHDDPNSVRLDPGKQGEIIWKFTNSGKFEFACLIPGHYDSGMKGDISVAEKTVSN